MAFCGVLTTIFSQLDDLYNLINKKKLKQTFFIYFLNYYINIY